MPPIKKTFSSIRQPALAFILLICSIIVKGQSIDSIRYYRQDFDELYGLNADLYNGMKYFQEHQVSYGTPFWHDNQDNMATLVLSGITYTLLNIQYELSIQEFILKYRDLHGASQQIIINRPRIDSVLMDGHLFVKSPNKGIREPFVEEIVNGTISCYYGLNKEYRFVNSGTRNGYEYSRELKTMYLILDHQVLTFKNNRSLLKLLPEPIRRETKVYLSEHRIKIKKADEATMKLVFNYCNNLTHP